MVSGAFNSIQSLHFVEKGNALILGRFFDYDKLTIFNEEGMGEDVIRQRETTPRYQFAIAGILN
jgi:hypothetical protein